MAGNGINIIEKNSIILSRNTPVALVVGAAGFLGSHLTDALLAKGIQVVGVDNFKSGKKKNLEEAVKSKNFHLINESAQNLKLDLPRLDYLFVVSSGDWNIDAVLEQFRATNCRCLFVSSIDLYKSEADDNLEWFKQTESKIAKFAQEHKLNARVLRLSPVFGPRMHFRIKDPLVKLLHTALTADLQKEVDLDFSSRALYVSDAVELMVKCMLAGATALKIFDGSLYQPFKISEIKQVLLDPVWYEERGFKPSELPPWPTPNLEKTRRFLNWYPKLDLVTALRVSINYFKENEIPAESMDEEKKEISNLWREEKSEHLEAFKNEEPKEKGIKLPKFPLPLSKIYITIALIFIFYALIWPITVLGWGVFTFRHQLTQAVNNLEKGEFSASLDNIAQAESGVVEAKTIIDSLDAGRKTGLLKKQFEAGDNLLELAELSTKAARATILGTEALYDGLKAVTGELSGEVGGYFNNAQIELAQADHNLAVAQTLIKDNTLKQKIPVFLNSRINSLGEKLKIYSDLVSKARAASIILPEIVALDGKKDYLILLQNNNELRPAGGFIGSFAKISFEGGKLKKLEVNDIYAIDGQLKVHVEPPKEIKEDLGQNSWYLRDSNWEPDYPTSARQAEWFYTKEVGEVVSGVVALDVSAMEGLLRVIGSLDLPDYNEEITSENLFEKAITHAEQGFFPGSQSKKSFITALTMQLFNKVFFLPKQNWPGIVTAIATALEEKHISVYLNDPKLFSYLLSQNWAGALPRTKESIEGEVFDLLAPVEANLGANKVNYYLDRQYSLDTTIGKEGEIKHRLKITYLNRSPSDTWPGGLYKNRMRIYLPFGSKVDKLLWGEVDKLKEAVNFVDFGRSGLSILLELSPKEQKSLIVEYEPPLKMQFRDDKATYRLDVIKQAGTLKDPFEWRVTYPINYQLMSQNAQNIAPQEQVIQTDLSVDRSFEVQFKK